MKVLYVLSFARISPSVNLVNLHLSNIKLTLDNSEFNIVILIQRH